MQEQESIRGDLVRVLWIAAWALFAIPVLTYGFVRYAQASQDREYAQYLEQQVRSSQLASEQQEALLATFRQHPLSRVCDDAEPAVETLRVKACRRWGRVWQFDKARKASQFTLVLGAAILAVIGALGMLAFLNRAAQRWSLAAGWRLLMVGSAAEVALQGAMCLWLSFWVTAFFFERYFVKLVVIAAILAVVGIAATVRAIFRRPRLNNRVVGESVSEANAPLLWRRIREIAAAMKTAPPDHLVAGIDANFFVTESGLTLADSQLTGRCLYVSIPLLRIMDRPQAEAVLAHELAHFRGGDTRAGAQLGPQLLRFDHYVHAMGQGGLTRLVWPFMRLYRLLLQLALSRDSREREFLADRVAAQLTSPQAVVESLVKVVAYAHYRESVEESLFKSRKKLEGDLGMAASVAAGLHGYARSADLIDDIHHARVPHPFDSHPPLKQRMQNVGFQLGAADYGRTVGSPPGSSWAHDVASADAIEQRLWAAYEAAFSQQHELSLAYRYWPRNDEEASIVLKYFPPLSFSLRGGASIEVNHHGMAPSGEPELHWDDVQSLEYKDGSFGDSLIATLNEKGLVGQKTRQLGLAGIGKQKAAFKDAVGRYWHRHKAARGQA